MNVIRWCPSGPPEPDRLQCFVKDAAGLGAEFWQHHEACSCPRTNACRRRRPSPQPPPKAPTAPPVVGRVRELPALDFPTIRARAAVAANIERGEARPWVG